MKSGVTTSPIDMKERTNLQLRAGDTVRVWQKIEELKTAKGKNKKDVTTRSTRKQAFEGLVLAVKHGTEPGATFTVRRVASGVGVEKIFPLYSPNIESIEILRRARVRRSKLYFIRRKAAKEVARAMRKQLQITPAASDPEKTVSEEAAAEKETPQESAEVRQETATAAE
jgi:large subunit ribosomal protein L19